MANLTSIPDMGCWWGCVVAPFFQPFCLNFFIFAISWDFRGNQGKMIFSFWRKVLISPPNYRKISRRILLVQKIPISPQTPPQNPFFCVYSFSGPGSANFLSLFFFFIPAWLPLQCMRFSPGTAAPLRRCIHLGHRLPWPCSHARTIFLFRGPRTLMYDASSAGLRPFPYWLARRERLTGPEEFQRRKRKKTLLVRTWTWTWWSSSCTRP